MLYANPILIVAAVLPAAWLLLKVYKADKLEKEPPKLLVALVIFGVISTFLAMVAEQIGVFLLDIFFIEDSVAYRVLMYFGVVAFSEEGFKYLLLKKRTWYSPEFNCRFDGVVYAVFVSLGFALWENIRYVLSFGFQTAMLRAVTAVPGHACFGVFMGVWYGAAKSWESAGDPARSKRCRTQALLLPVVLHGAYDFIASGTSLNSAWFFVGFIAILFTIALILVRRMSATDNYFHRDDSPYY